jgi:hypothetical protein
VSDYTFMSRMQRSAAVDVNSDDYIETSANSGLCFLRRTVAALTSFRSVSQP